MTRLKKLLNNVKWFFQRVFRKNHISDIETWECNHYLAKFILPRLKALRKQELFCYPPDDVSSISVSKTVADENSKEDKENLAAWYNKIDEMIFAFEYALYEDSTDKNSTDFYIRYYGEDPYEKFNKDFDAGTLNFNDENVNYEIVNKAHQRALKGFELFGKYFLYLYD